MIQFISLAAVSIGLGTIAPSAFLLGGLSISKKISDSYDSCMANGDYATTDCAKIEWDIRDQSLNQAYAMVMKRQNQAGKTKLRNLQRAWIKQRDSRCQERDEPRGEGYTDPADVYLCMADETYKRTLWLEKYK
ncbi:MAG: lysozyme inhibitor LprI family protein [Sphingorhabdus sp.]